VVDPLKRLGAGGTAEIKDHPYFASIDWLKLQNLTLPPPFIPEGRTVHAESIAEVGEFNNHEYRSIKITAKENELYDKEFVFISQYDSEREIAKVLLLLYYD